MSGFTAVPRWTTNPVPGVGEHKLTIPGELMAALRRLANELAAPLSSVLLAAHAKVLGALSGEREVCTGYAVEAGPPLPCRMTIGHRTWRELVLEAARAESVLGPSGPSFETVFKRTAGCHGELAQGIVLSVAFAGQEGHVLRLRYRTDVLGANCAARIAGYHLTALARI